MSGRERVRLGSGYRRLWTATAVSSLGDGVYFTALPLLAVSLTRDPVAVSLVTLATTLPNLLLTLTAGVLVDRWDRRRVLWRVDAFRFLVVAALAAAVLGGWVGIPLLMAVGFLLGAGETLFATAAQALLPLLVSREPERLELANGRLLGVQTLSGQLVGPPLGGLLFSLARWLPFGVDALSFAASSALIATIPGRYAAGRQEGAPRATIRADIAEGLRWLLGHRLLRTLGLMVGVVNLVATGWIATAVLFATERLGLGPRGYGLLTSGLAVGSVAGTLLAPRLSRRFGVARVLLGSALTESVVTILIGLQTNPLVAGALLGLEGVAVMGWNTVSVALRQSLIPDRMYGRAASVYRLVAMGSTPLGAALGGGLARLVDLRAPWLVAGCTELVVLAVVGRSLTSRAVARARAEAALEGSQPGAVAT
jgi:MFS family permease